MRYRYTFLLLFLLCAVALSQQPVHDNLLEYFDKVPAPPSSAKEAYQKCVVRVPGQDDQVVADSLFKPVVDQLTQIQTDIARPSKSPQAEFAEKMKDPAFQKKLQAMSEAERMKIMMELNEAMGATPGPMKPEPRSVLACMEEVGKLNETAAGQMEDLNANTQTAIQRGQKLQKQHGDIDTWEQAEIAKLPEVQGQGEGGGGPDPNAVYAIKLRAINKHLALVEEELKKTDKTWVEQRQSSRKLFTPYEKSLEKTHYGDDARNKMSKTNLSTGQTLMIGSITNLISESQHAYQDGANWYALLVQLQKTNQQ